MKRKKDIDEIEILEFDEDKKKGKIDNIKVFLSNKRNKAIVKLGIYFIFLLFVVLYIRFNSTSKLQKNYEPTNIIEKTDTITNQTAKLKLLNNYDINIKYEIISDNNYNYELNLKKENDIVSVKMNDITYYQDENGFYELINNNKNYTDNRIITDLPLYLPNKLYNYLLQSKFQYKKEDLNSNKTINSLLKVSDFAYINNNIISNSDDIIIETMENNTNEISIIMDMTNYYKINENNIIKYIININIK